jgi:prolyl-tRNA synthetase
MRWTNTFIPTLKENPQEAESISHRLMLRAGLVRMLVAGVYSYLPLGFKVLENIENIIRQEMDKSKAAQLLLPALQPKELWLKSNRDADIGEVMIRFQDRRGRHMCLGPTHEEVITNLVGSNISSYRHLPLVLYQIQTKFRDEIRPRFGVVRACEFIMKDAYSFDRDEAGLDKNYGIMYQAYQRILKRCGLDYLIVEADSGVMGGKVSHEFMVPAASGEDMALVCPKCKATSGFSAENASACSKCGTKPGQVNTIEIGHIFKLGTKYSQSLGANFINEKGKLEPIIMGCYGIGVSRLIAAIIEQNNDDYGIIWPAEISPYKVLILPLDTTNSRIMKKTDRLYKELQKNGIEVLLDDREERAGVKFKDADLLGVSLQVIIGKESLKNNTVELKLRKGNKKLVKPADEALSSIIKLTKVARLK